MAKVTVIDKQGEIDGRPIKWTVLSIIGSLDGKTHTLELKLNKTESMLARILLDSKENLSVVNGGQGGNVNVTKIPVKSDDDEMDDFLNGIQA